MKVTCDDCKSKGTLSLVEEGYEEYYICDVCASTYSTSEVEGTDE